MERIRRHLETRSAYNKMSPEQVLLTENRIMTFGFGPENFVESEGYSGYSFDEKKEAAGITEVLATLNAVDLKVLRAQLLSYEDYLSSLAGKLAAFEGKKPTLEKDHIGHFGVAQRASFLLKATREEMAKRKLGFWNTLHLVPQAMRRLDGIREEVGVVRENKEEEEQHNKLLGDHHVEDTLEMLDEIPNMPREESEDKDDKK